MALPPSSRTQRLSTQQNLSLPVLGVLTDHKYYALVSGDLALRTKPLRRPWNLHSFSVPDRPGIRGPLSTYTNYTLNDTPAIPERPSKHTLVALRRLRLTPPRPPYAAPPIQPALLTLGNEIPLLSQVAQNAILNHIALEPLQQRLK